ncbi:phage virion morphogenesis protein [Thermomonas hydrothermalis]|nr:phage virion morphogenesis protein [Thermomonas hydrothermalis]
MNLCNDREVRQALENLQRRVSDLTPVMHDIGQALVEGTRERILSG